MKSDYNHTDSRSLSLSKVKAATDSTNRFGFEKLSRRYTYEGDG